MTIRAKKLGVLIRDARLASRRRIEDCAETLQVSSQDFEAFELGEKSPSLSKLEVLAYFWDTVDHFEAIKPYRNGSPALNFDINQLAGLRQR
jgi:transcriptional regulator with XRE-family HTH domain